MRCYRYPLRLLAHERAAVDMWRVQCCTLYNAALEQRRDGWKRQRRLIGYFLQCKDLTDLRQEPEWRATPVQCQQNTLHNVDRSFAAFFRRCKAGQTPGHPRFRARERYSSISFPGRDCPVEPAPLEGGSGYIQIPKLGRVRFKQHRPMQGQVREVTLRVDARGRWFVSMVCDVGEAPEKRTVRAGCVTGIDLGLKEFAVLSSGEAIANPRFYRRGQESLARAQRVLALKKRGSNSRRRAKRAVGRCHERVSHQRLDFHRKLAKNLCSRFDLIAHEDLNVRGLARGMLSKSVADVGWGQFISILGHKAEEAGVHLVAVDPRNTTQACSSCSAIVPKGLGDRVHRCGCGCVLDRDHNAALNVLARGLRAVPAETQAIASF